MVGCDRRPEELARLRRWKRVVRRYRIHGLDVAGDITLAGFPPRDDAGPRSVRLEPAAPEVLDATWSGAVRGGSGGAATVGRAGDIRFDYRDGQFLATAGGRTVLCHPTSAGIGWQATLLDEVLPRVALMRGLCVLEGAAIETSGGVIALLGEPHVRASAVTELLARGHTLVSANRIALGARGTTIEAHPGPPLFCVPLPAGRSVADPRIGRTLATFGSEAWVGAHRAATSAMPLASICTLRTDDDHGTLAPLPPTALALSRYDLRATTQRRPARPDLDFYAELAAMTPQWRVVAHDSAPGELADLVLASLDTQQVRAAA